MYGQTVTERKPFVVGLAGGSGAGKTTVARALNEAVPDAALISYDSYYRDQSHLTLDERHEINYDHPDSFETELFVKHLDALAEGTAVDVPLYDYSQHVRGDRIQRVEPGTGLILEGILLFVDPDLRSRIDLKVYVDTRADTRISRRMRRDVTDRGRTVASVLAQWEATVRPMHDQFVAPTRAFADLVILGGHNGPAIEALAARMRGA